MTDPISSPSFEEKLRLATKMPAPRAEFLNDLRRRIAVESLPYETRHIRPASTWRRPALLAPLAVLIVLVVGIALVGPQRVIAAVSGLFGYIPGVGVVDRSVPIRVLAAPLTQTRGGVSVTVSSATLTADRTHVDYRIFGVPASAYPDREDVTGCTTPEFLRLPDGTQLTRSSDFPPIPAGVGRATLVIPCILNTLPGKAPENWELALSFVPAPPDLTVMPVVEVSPSTAAPSPVASQAAVPTPSAAAASAQPTPVESWIAFDQVIETQAGYILTARFAPQFTDTTTIQVMGPPELHDAHGKKVAYTYPTDVESPNAFSPAGGFGMALEFNAAGLAYPLSLSIQGYPVRPASPAAQASFSFDAGDAPQPGQTWTPGQEIQLAGHTLKLVSVTTDGTNGYSFRFTSDPQVVSASVQIEGLTPDGGGGSRGAPGAEGAQFSASLSFPQIPTGKLEVTVSDLMLRGDAQTWEAQWSPETPRTDLPANPTAQPGLCLAGGVETLQPAPADLASGSALTFDALDGGKWGLVLHTLDGSRQQVLAADTNWGALSPDGSRAAYPQPDGIHIVDLATQAETVLAGANGYNLHWSPDGRQIAYSGADGGSVFVVDVAGGASPRQISDQARALVAGWMPDGATVELAIPFTGNSAWQMRAVSLADGSYQDQFIIENGTPKALDPSLSPDGRWIAYRGRDNSSLYLVRPDGSDMHLVLDAAGVAGIAWSQNGWLGISLMAAGTDAQTIVLLKPESCEAYEVRGLHGTLAALSMLK